MEVLYEIPVLMLTAPIHYNYFKGVRFYVGIIAYLLPVLEITPTQKKQVFDSYCLPVSNVLILTVYLCADRKITLELFLIIINCL